VFLNSGKIVKTPSSRIIVRTYASTSSPLCSVQTLLDATACAMAASRDPVVASAPDDPWERQNRKNYAIEGVLDRRLIGPASRLYHKLTPGPIGRGIHNVLINLSEPAVIINDVLQLRFKRAGVSATRLVTNSTLGLLGLLDASRPLWSCTSRQ